MFNQKGVIHLALPLLLLLVGAAIFVLYSLGYIKNPLQNLPLVGQKTPEVDVKTEYQNPFDKKTQYENPFDDSKSPLINLKK